MKNDQERIGFNLRGAVLRYCAKNPTLTQKDIAKKIGINPVSLSRVLHGGGASEAMIEKISSVVGANPLMIMNKGRKTPKYTAKTLKEIVSDVRVLRQYIGPTDRTGLEWANKELWQIVNALKDHRMKLQREQVYRL